jgi:ABC-2 type transport system permease protein
MRNIWIIAKREYDHYFITPIAYIVAFVILVFLGFLFFAVVADAIQNSFTGFGFGSAPDVRIICSWFAILLMFACPALTMRLLAEESKTGTIELLLTAPIRDIELVLGKWLGSLLFVLTLVAVALIYPIILNGIHFGEFSVLPTLVSPSIDWPLTLSSYLGVILVAASFLALGVGVSAMFSNQIAAFFVSFLLSLGLYIFIGIPAQILPAGGAVFDYLSMGTHFNEAFLIGKIYLTDILYFVSLIFLGLFIGTMAIESRRWN